MKRTHNKHKTPEGHKTCFVSKETFERGEMLRFVVSPDKTVFFDAAEKLPGRGMWLRADYQTLKNAVEKRIFFKAAKGTVNIPADLVMQVEMQLKNRVLSLLGLARKAGALVFGYEGVKKALTAREAALAFEATDSSERERDKLYHYEHELKIYDVFTREELGRVAGMDAVAHMAVLHGKVAKELNQNVHKLVLFLQSKGESL